MKGQSIGTFLFALAGITSLPAFGSLHSQGKDFFLPEELPIEQRKFVYERANEILIKNPEIADEAAVVMVDREGNVYVLDKNLVQLAGAGEPSCRGGGR